MTQEIDESLEQWSDRVIETAQRAHGARVPGQVLQEQTVLRFAMGCQDTRAGRSLIDTPPISLDEAVRCVKTYQLSRRAFTPRRRVLHAMSYGDPSSEEETYRSPSLVPHRERYRVKTPERSRTQTYSFSRLPSKIEDRAPRERQGDSSPFQTAVGREHAMSVTVLDISVTTVQGQDRLALPLATKRAQIRSM